MYAANGESKNAAQQADGAAGNAFPAPHNDTLVFDNTFASGFASGNGAEEIFDVAALQILDAAMAQQRLDMVFNGRFVGRLG